MAFPTIYQEFIYKRTYARWLEDQGRRENWNETVARYEDCLGKKVPSNKKYDWHQACDAIRNLEVMPSMRSLWTAGPALERENVSGFNCAYAEISSIKSFAEVLYILMCGTGVGFSVERQVVAKLPQVPDKLEDVDDTIVVADSKKGWAEAYLALLRGLYDGKIKKWDMSRVRPKGAKLKVFGGRASGPDPLVDLIKFTGRTFKAATGRRLNSLECHDLVCKIASIVFVGGVRRSACISLSNLSDDRMAHAKDGMFWDTNPQRMLANNSVAYTEKPDTERFIQEWLNLIRSKSGERGIFNRESAKFIVSQIGRRDPNYDLGVNPCSEIILRPSEFCNLSEVVVRPKDTIKALKEKVRRATILGAVQSTYTDFQFIGRDWKRNCDEERLLGVSLTGLRDHPILGHKSREAELMLVEMKQEAIDTAKEWSEILGINMPAAITCTKPSGSVSQLVDSASGLHHRYSPYYIRRVRVTANDPLARILVDAGVPYNPEVGETMENANTYVFDFPVKAPENAVFRDEETALQQLEYWLMIQKCWCEHKPSITVFVKDDEWLEIGSWVYKNWNYVSGISFLPMDGGVYQLAPYEEISEEQYDELLKAMPEIDFEKLTEYEREDATQGSREFACQGNSCELA